MYTSNENETRNDFTTGDFSLSLHSDVTYDPHANHNVESNRDMKVMLNLVHTFTQDADCYAAFSSDGEYLATVSEIGAVQIFDVMSDKRLRLFLYRLLIGM